MRPDDPRHGHRAGYIAGCREDCCRVPHIRYQKRSALRRLREGAQYLDPGPVLRRLDKWAAYGVTARAVAIAAGLNESTLQGIVRDGFRPEKRTLAATLAVTWNDLPDSALVNADLTRRRIYSLMAAGHRLEWICERVDGLNLGGKWREQEKVTLGLARAVMALYDQAPAWGPSKQTASKARNKGHRTPAAWDDPGVPAMPKGWQPVIDDGTDHRRNDDVDEVVVMRLLAGEHIPSTRAEKDEVMKRWKRAGGSEAELCRIHGWKDSRYGREEAA